MNDCCTHTHKHTPTSTYAHMDTSPHNTAAASYHLPLPLCLCWCRQRMPAAELYNADVAAVKSACVRPPRRGSAAVLLFLAVQACPAAFRVRVSPAVRQNAAYFLVFHASRCRRPEDDGASPVEPGAASAYVSNYFRITVVKARKRRQACNLRFLREELSNMSNYQVRTSFRSCCLGS